MGDRHRIEVLPGDAGLNHRLGNDRDQQLEVGTTGDLGHDATEAGVQVHLGGHDRGQDILAEGHHRRRRLVARGLDAQHEAPRRSRR